MALPVPESSAPPLAPQVPPVGLPIVGIGASAGGLAAFEAFFSGMPSDAAPGMAFVLVQHLAPDHTSLLTELLRRCTRMPVLEVEDGMVVQVNCVYVIPPGCDMACINGTLQLLKTTDARGLRLPINFFFRSLAQDQGERAIGIILSGTGSDGTLGVRAIKGEGGMVMAQSMASCEFDGMPRSAIATGLVDFELPPAEMPAKLMAYIEHSFGKLRKPTEQPPRQTQDAMNKVFVLLRDQTGHDFSRYKLRTIQRRIERRMALHQIDAMDVYVKYLQAAPAEVEALFRDMLIGVTSFFRDPDAFKVLQERAIPAIFANKAPGEAVRVWTAGCSTGEEAYSIAMLLVEHMDTLNTKPMLQLFASDIDARAIATARAGLYPATIAADLTPERLARFFTLEPDGSAYRVSKRLRDLLVFSEQDIIKDPPFSRLDLITCRNLMIYMDAALQKGLIPLFHYALVTAGWLFLGTSESVGEFDALFAVVDRTAKLYQRKEDAPGQQRPSQSRALLRLNGWTPAVNAPDASAATQGLHSAALGQQSAGRSLRETTEQALLEHVIAAGALVNAAGDILYLHGRTGMFLELSPGDAGVNNVVKMAREGLRRELARSLKAAVAMRETVLSPGLRVKTNGHFSLVDLAVCPVFHGAGARSTAPLFLVILEAARAAPSVRPPAAAAAAETDVAPAPGAPVAGASDAQARIAELKGQLLTKGDELQDAVDDLQTVTAELRSANEGMQSVNEELHSANEELETSKEELQSVNEELSTVNAELQNKVTDLSRANNDMNNLLAGTGIGTVFVDHQLRVLRFTPAARKIINLIPSDIGRPVAHIVSNLVGYSSLVADVREVLNTLVPKEVEVASQDGRQYTVRMQPYRTLDNVIEGAVISFVDITEMKVTRDALLRSALLIAGAGQMAHVGGWSLTVPDMSLQWTEETFKIHDVASRENPTLEEAIAFYEPEGRAVVQATLQAAIAHGEPWRFELPLVTAHGRRIWVRALGSAEVQGGKTVRLNGAIQDITESKQAAEALRQANGLKRLAVVVRDAQDAITLQDLAGHTLAWNPGAQRLYGWTEAEALAQSVSHRIPEALRATELDMLVRLGRAEVIEPYSTRRLNREGQEIAVSIVATALLDESGKMYAVATTERARAPNKA
jgi:two-component system CheB/CheR fusion protein